MRQSTTVLFALVMVSAVRGFQVERNQVRTPTMIHYSWSSDEAFPKNATATTTATTSKEKKVYVNKDYVAPITVTPTRTPKKQLANSQTLQGANYFHEMAEQLQQIPNKLLKEAGSNFQDIGFAWQEGDWEAVAYGALEASQTLKLYSTSLNKRHGDNELQQSIAGISVQLLQLSNSQEPSRINLQGLALRFYQASRSTYDDDINRCMEQASKSAQALAKLYGAQSYYLPRRFQLWWQDRQERKRRRKDHHNADDPFQ